MKANKVIFAECGEDFVEFLFNLLSLPVSRIIEIISKESMVGSLGNIYQSMRDLKQPFCSNPFGNNNSSFSSTTNMPLLLPQPSPAAAAAGLSLEGGLVKEQSTFMVMDDLKVSRLSVGSGLTLLNKLGCNDLAALVEEEVEFGHPEALEFLKASLHSKRVLTNVYLVKEWALLDAIASRAKSQSNKEDVDVEALLSRLGFA
ncbi:unnamed protein product [Linum tenue]|uniref:Uncharacterized protein n=1 Tax=Linum tenue TaxID=586396 RepID=A0AAV0M9V5_9ROSI|nr:unnamed protein product [Linum tenue]